MEQNELAGSINIEDTIFSPSLYSVVRYQLYFTRRVLSGSDVDGTRTLCTQVSAGEVRKVKHTGFLQRKEIVTCLPPGLQPGDPLLSVEPDSDYIPQNLCFTYPRSFSPKF